MVLFGILDLDKKADVKTMKNRSLVTMLLLTIVTLGIYQLYWLYDTQRELRAKNYNVPSILILFAPYLALIGIILLNIIINFVFSTTDGGTTSPGILGLLSLIIGVVAFIALVPVALYWYYRYCKAIELVTDGTFPFDMSYLSIILLSIFGVNFVWPFFVQYYLNRTTNSTVQSVRI